LLTGAAPGWPGGGGGIGDGSRGGTVANWFVSVGGQTSGPHPDVYVVHWVRTGQVPPDAGFWLDGGDGWQQLPAAWPLLTGVLGEAPPVLGPPVAAPPPAAPPLAAPPPAAPPPAAARPPAAGPPPVAWAPDARAPDARAPDAWAQPRPPSAGAGGLPVGSGGVVLDTGRLGLLGQPGQPGQPWGAPTSVTGGTASAAPRDGSGPSGTSPPSDGPPTSGHPEASQASQASWGAVHAVTDRLADFAGVERVEGFPLRELLSAAFRRYGREEMERHFATGLPGFTPELSRIQSGWPKPWMFVRLLIGSWGLFLGFLLLIQVFQNTKLLPGLIVIGSFAVPAAVMVFFFEVNSPRNVSLYFMIHCMMVGSLISLALTLVFDQSAGGLGDLIGPPLAGFVEELGKLVAVMAVTYRLPGPRYPWILNGMLFGAAVGAGFAAFESAGYAFNFLVTGNGFDLNGATQTIVIRGLLAPFGHVVWTALAAGALWRVKLDQPLTLKMLVHKRVLRMFLVVMVLHAIWDLTFLDPPFLLKYLVLGFFAWVLAIGMLQTGLKQIKAAQLSLAAGQPQVSGATVVLRQTPSIGG
jgi:protease PrsW